MRRVLDTYLRLRTSWALGLSGLVVEGLGSRGLGFRVQGLGLQGLRV